MKVQWVLNIAIVLGFASVGHAAKPRCLYISSYHQGYAWSDGVERGVREALGDQCEFKQFDMDTKRNADEKFILEQAKKSKELVESWKPDVVIVSDDIAAKEVIVPYFKDAKTPFVFCGVNWSAEEYGFPFKNVTGIIEIAPVKEMLEKAKSITGGNRAIYIGADTLTETKNLDRFEEAAPTVNVILDKALVSTTEDWLKIYNEAQQKYDFIVVGSKAGINDWDPDKIDSEIMKTTRILSVTNHSWMMPFTVYGMAKVPKEHGDKAAQYALKILSGTAPSDLPIIANEQWETWVNEQLMNAGHIDLGPLPKENVFAVDGGEIMLKKKAPDREQILWIVLGGIVFMMVIYLVKKKR